MEWRGERKKKRGDDVGRREGKCPGDAHGIGKVSWQPACCHGDGMTVRPPGKQGCWLPRTTAQLGGQTKNFLCRLADEGGRFCRCRLLLLLLGVDSTRDETEQDELRSAPRRRKEKRSRGEHEGRVGAALRRGNKCVLARGGRRAAGGRGGGGGK